MSNTSKRDEIVAGGVAGAAFFASAAHIVSVVHETNHLAFSLVYPLGIDGLIYVGIRAVQQGRKKAGFAAILVGALYSLAFNAHAEGAFTMSKLLVAASMPIAMLVSFAIVHTGHKVEEIPAPVATPIAVPVAKPIPARVSYPVRPALVRPATAFLPIVPKAAPVRIKATVPVRPTPTRPAITVRPSTTGRTIAWDVRVAVELMDEGRTNDEIGTKVGTAPKQIQRARRVLGFVRTTAMTDTDIHATITGALSLPVIAAIREAASK